MLIKESTARLVENGLSSGDANATVVVRKWPLPGSSHCVIALA